LPAAESNGPVKKNDGMFFSIGTEKYKWMSRSSNLEHGVPQVSGETKEENKLFCFKNPRTEIQVSCQNAGGIQFFNSATARAHKSSAFQKKKRHAKRKGVFQPPLFTMF